MKILGAFLFLMVVYDPIFCILSIEDSFKKFETKKGRSYSTPAERNFRFEVFKRNLEFIRLYEDTELAKINGAVLLGAGSVPAKTYTKKINNFADLSDDEFSNYYLLPSAIVSKAPKDQKSLSKSSKNKPKQSKKKRLLQTPASPAHFGLKPKVDWMGFDTPVKNQLRCNSCYAFAVNAMIEVWNKIERGTVISLSEQELLDCDSKNYHCLGGVPTYTMDYILENDIAFTDNYPYEGKKGDKCKIALTKRLLKAGSSDSLKKKRVKQVSKRILPIAPVKRSSKKTENSIPVKAIASKSNEPKTPPSQNQPSKNVNNSNAKTPVNSTPSSIEKRAKQSTPVANSNPVGKNDIKITSQHPSKAIEKKPVGSKQIKAVFKLKTNPKAAASNNPAKENSTKEANLKVTNSSLDKTTPQNPAKVTPNHSANSETKNVSEPNKAVQTSDSSKPGKQSVKENQKVQNILKGSPTPDNNKPTPTVNAAISNATPNENQKSPENTPSVKPVTPTNNNTRYSGLRSYKIIAANILAVLQALEKGPIVVGMHVSNELKFYHTGIFNGDGCKSDSIPNHAATALGYDLNANPPYIVFKNSWGTDWGENGYFKVAIGEISPTSKGICLIGGTNFGISPVFSD